MIRTFELQREAALMEMLLQMVLGMLLSELGGFAVSLPLVVPPCLKNFIYVYCDLLSRS